MRYALIGLCAACGAAGPASLSGEWAGGFYGVDGAALSCGASSFTGTFQLEVQAGGAFAGEWALCGSLAGTITGETHPDQSFEFTLDGDGVAVIGMLGADDSLNGEVVGLADGVWFHAKRVK